MSIECKHVRRALERAGAGQRVHCLQTGVGARRVHDAVREWATGAAGETLVILAGVCGGLVETEDVPRIERVVDANGNEWRIDGLWRGPHLRGETHSTDSSSEHEESVARDTRGVTLFGADDVISTPEEKAELARRTGASIVDMECHGFMRAIDELNAAGKGGPFRAAVVRGVSDEPGETLPREVLNWLRPDGSAKVVRPVVDMAVRPRLVAPVMRAMRRTDRVMGEVGERVVEILRAWEEGERV